MDNTQPVEAADREAQTADIRELKPAAADMAELDTTPDVRLTALSSPDCHNRFWVACCLVIWNLEDAKKRKRHRGQHVEELAPFLRCRVEHQMSESQEDTAKLYHQPKQKCKVPIDLIKQNERCSSE